MLSVDENGFNSDRPVVVNGKVRCDMLELYDETT